MMMTIEVVELVMKTSETLQAQGIVTYDDPADGAAAASALGIRMAMHFQEIMKEREGMR